MRLINADALKADFEREKELNPYDALFFDKAIAIISNAPTVETPDAMWDAYCEGQKVGYEKALSERPQGEWITREDMDYLDENKVVHNHFQCNKCGFIHDFIDGHTSQYNFCPNCGKDMRGEK